MAVVCSDGKKRNNRRATASVVPITVVGTVVAGALMVLLLLTQSRLSQLGFEISALEKELEALEVQQEKLLIAYAQAYSLDRVEGYATQILGMVHPNPDQYRLIDSKTAEHSQGDIE